MIFILLLNVMKKKIHESSPILCFGIFCFHMKLQGQTNTCSADAWIKIKLLVLHYLFYKSSAGIHDPDTNEAIESTGHITGKREREKKRSCLEESGSLRWISL